MEQLSLCVETHHLAARAETRVYGQCAFLSHRSGQQQLTQVLGKDSYSLAIGLFFQKVTEFSLYRRSDETFVTVGNSQVVLFAGFPLRTLPRGESLDTLVVLVGPDMHLEHSCFLATKERQDAMRRSTANRFLPVEPRFELAHTLVIFIHTTGKSRSEHSPATEHIAHTIAAGCVLADTLGDDVACACQSLIVPFVPMATHNGVGNGLVALLDSYGSTCTAFGPIRQI